MTKSEYEKAVRDAERARCAVCSGKVALSDLCQDGLYIHVECARKTMTLPDVKRAP